MQTTGIAIPRTSNADATTILFNIVMSKQMSKSDPFNSGRGKVSC